MGRLPLRVLHPARLVTGRALVGIEPTLPSTPFGEVVR